ncbi:MAG: hypothetical protein P4L73_13460 [Caulobacteraceae bacterium]|nr:hypothetical protein [Caulobacteraceae bacterium]
MRDLHHNIKAIRCISPVSLGTTGVGKTGKVIDRQGFDSVEFVFDYGAITATNATVTPTILEGDTTGAMTSVADANLLGLEANAAIGATTPRASGVSMNVTRRVGYIGPKRYVTAKLVATTSAAIVAAATVILGAAHDHPVAT